MKTGMDPKCRFCHNETIHHLVSGCPILAKKAYLHRHSDHSDDEMEAEYEKLERVISNIPQKDLLIVTGDVNDIIGNTKNDDYIKATLHQGNMLPVVAVVACDRATEIVCCDLLPTGPLKMDK